MAIGQYFKLEKRPHRGLLAAEWMGVGYMGFTLLLMALLWTKLVDPAPMLWGRFHYAMVTLALWGVYRMVPCRMTLMARVLAQMMFLSFWYSDTYELNRLLPNLDHLFAAWEQHLFGAQPALLFAQKVPYAWASELMCLGYTSYFPLIALVAYYYFFRRYQEFGMAAFVLLGSFFIYYVIFVLLPVTGPQFYYLAAGTDRIAAADFPNLHDWFLTHREMMEAPGWKDGFWYHMLQLTHDAGERPTAAFPSSHVGVATIVVMLALRTRERWLVAVVVPFYVLLCCSTVYILAHYAIDVVGGFVTGLLLYLGLCFCYAHFGLDRGLTPR